MLFLLIDGVEGSAGGAGWSPRKICTLVGKARYPRRFLGAIWCEGLQPIAAWRRYRGLPYAKAARRTGLSQAWLSRIESGGGAGGAQVGVK